MKKILKIGAIVLTVALAAIAMSACSASEIDKEIRSNISEIRSNMYVSKSDNAEITLITGERENPYKVDGISHDMEEYSILTVKPAAGAAENLPFTYKITAGKNEYSGALTVHPFGVTYTATLNRKIEGEFTIKIESEQLTEEAVMTPQASGDMLDWEGALLAGINTLNSKVKSLYEGKKLAGEVYVQFVSDPMNNDGGYFWYVAFVGQNGTTCAALLDPVTGEPVALKK